MSDEGPFREEIDKRISSLIANTADEISILAPDGTLLYESPNAHPTLGYPAGKYIGQSLWHLLHPDDRERVQEHFRQLVGEPGGTRRAQFRLRHADGSWKWIDAVGTNHLAEPSVAGIVLNYHDITELKLEESRLQTSDQILERVRALVVVSDANGDIIFVNPFVAEVTGYPVEELLGDGWWKRTRSPSQGLIDKEHLHKLATGELPIAERSYVNQLRIRDGNVRLIEWQDARGPDQTIIGVGQDITDRRRAEEHHEQQMQRLMALRAIDLAISSSVDKHTTLGILLQRLIGSLKVDAADILLLRADLGYLELVADQGFHSYLGRLTLPISSPYAGEAALEGRMIAVLDLKRTAKPFARSELMAQEGFQSYFAVPLLTKGEVKGVLEVFNRTPLDPDAEWQSFLETIAGQAAIAIDNADLFEDLQRSNLELAIAYERTIEGWSRALDLRDKETEGHTQRVTDMTAQLALDMGMPVDELPQVRRGGLLHDIGKMGVPDSILLKPGPLTDEEWVLMRKHPTFAYELLSPIQYLQDAALEIPYCHHEKWDGTGYPRGLKGKQIPLAARIFAIIDVWDAITSDRPYRAAMPREQALQHIREQSNKHFDPDIVIAFLEMIRQN